MCDRFFTTSRERGGTGLGLAIVATLVEAHGGTIALDSVPGRTEARLCGDYPAVRYYPPDGFGLDVLTRLGEAFSYSDLEVEEKMYEGIPVRVVTPRTLWRLKKDAVRPPDRFDAEAIAERFGLRDD